MFLPVVSQETHLGVWFLLSCSGTFAGALDPLKNQTSCKAGMLKAVLQTSSHAESCGWLAKKAMQPVHFLGFLSVEPCPQGARCQWHPLFFFAAKGFPFKPQPAKQSRCPVFLVATLSKIRAGHMHSHYRVTRPPATCLPETAQGGMIAPGSGEFSVSSVESDLGLCDMGSKHFARRRRGRGSK